MIISRKNYETTTTRKKFLHSIMNPIVQTESRFHGFAIPSLDARPCIVGASDLIKHGEQELVIRVMALD